MFASRRLVRLAASGGLALALGGCISYQGGFVGPLVGHVETESATFWMYGGPGGEFELTVWEEASDREAATMTLRADPDERFAARGTVTGLTALTAYRYRIEPRHDPGARPAWSDGADVPVTGRFTTAPPEGEPGRFKVAVSSCVKPYPRWQGSWKRLLAEGPALQLMLGDNVYSQRPDREVIWRAHEKVRSFPEYAAAIRNIPTYAIWDDHDYAGDNAGGEVARKGESLRAFNEVWANPAAGTPETPGVFHRFRWGAVEFFMLDVRYHRSPTRAKNDETKRMLGEAQFAWLADGLTTSTATFKVIASGSTLDDSRLDSWRRFRHDRERLYRLIMDNRVGGVLFVTGDVHYSVIRTHDDTVTGGYPLTEVISSGIANSVVRSFAVLDFDTTREDPVVEIRIIDRHGVVREQTTLRRSEMTITELAPVPRRHAR